MLTTRLEDIHRTIAEARPVSARQVRRYIAACGVAPLGARQSPQRYPPDTAEKILVHLGLSPNGKNAGLVPLRELKRTAKKARAGK